MTNGLLQIENLTIQSVATQAPVVRNEPDGRSPAKYWAIIGESGSGKTTLCLAALGYVRPGLEITEGRVRLADAELLALPLEELRALRGRSVAYVAQSAAASFNPALTVGDQVIEPALVHQMMTAAEARARARELYLELGLPDPERIGARYPHQLSGGQLQRLMASMAMCCGPRFLILDEPTTALDVTTQIGVLKAFKDSIRNQGAGALYVSHDLAVVAQIADRVLVLRNGVVQEEGPVEQMVARPRTAYTRSLMEACNRWTPGVVRATAEPTPVPPPPVLELSSVTAGYGRGVDGNPATVAVKSVDRSLRRLSVLAVIGESGSGKSTLARVIAVLHEPAAGKLRLGGETLAGSVRNRSREQLRRIQIVFQSPDVSLNPAHNVAKILGRPLALFHGLDGRRRTERVVELLEMVQLPPEFVHRHPHELSGGQKQRINLARALAAEPELILCDEATSSLDTVVAASIIELLRRLRAESGLTFLFITHDVSMVAAFADEVAVMYRGEIVERGTTDAVLNRPEHAYTKVLISSVPQLRIGWLEEAIAHRDDTLKAANDLELAA
ncbi:MAG: ABC transporter ATP-binding protein [Betaproteobacteria bacterium]|nr:ABC transporter ATP-binding protein [Betaproteobacteria bacterium]